MTTAAATAIAATSGTSIDRVLELRLPGGTVYYGGDVRTIPVAGGGTITTEARIVDWGNLTLSPQPERIGGHGNVTLTIADPDLTFRDLLNTKPGLQNVDAYIHILLGGTEWPTDRITEFGGTVSTPIEWSTQDATWRVTLKGFESRYNRNVGIRIDKESFTTIRCDDCQGEIIPIVYGENVRRVPACMIDRPAESVLARGIGWFDTQIVLAVNAEDAGFPVGEPFTLQVGFPGQYEEFVGEFATGDTNIFDIASRSAVAVEAESLGTYASQGVTYLTIDPDDLGGNNYRGYLIAFPTLQTIEWMPHWIVTGEDSIAVVMQGEDRTFPSVGGLPYQIIAIPNMVPTWPVGAPAVEAAPLVYAVNHLPSAAVTRVEGKVRPQGPDGSSNVDKEQWVWLEYNAVYYDVHLDNKAYNAAIGRDAGDPGLTTISIDFSPLSLGFADNRLYVTLDGITDDETWEGTPITNPARVIESLLSSEFLGNVADKVNAASITAAATAMSAQSFAFAVQQPRQLFDLVSELAHQAMGIAFFDGGQFRLQRQSLTPTSVITLTADEVQIGSTQLFEIDSQALTNKLVGKFRQSAGGDDYHLTRISQEHIDEFDENEKEISLWAYQNPTDVARTLEFWLDYGLRRQRTIKVTTFLNAAGLQPGDGVTLNIQSAYHTVATGTARVVGIARQALSVTQNRMEAYTLTLELSLWTFTIQTETPSTTCEDNRRPALPAIDEEGSTSASTWKPGRLPWPSHLTGTRPSGTQSGTTVLPPFFPGPNGTGLGLGTDPESDACGQVVRCFDPETCEVTAEDIGSFARRIAGFLGM